MDKLLKTGKWIWFNKERMVLLVMVGFLIYRVYQVLNPPPPPVEAPLRPPGKEPPPEVRPVPPPLRPPPDLPGAYTSLTRRNPFSYTADRAGADSGGDVKASDLGLQLMDLQEASGRWRARIRTPTATKWYDEGKSFEEFELIRINPEDGTVEVFSAKYQRRFVLKKGS